MKSKKKSAQLVRSDQRLLLLGLFAAALLVSIFFIYAGETGYKLSF